MINSLKIAGLEIKGFENAAQFWESLNDEIPKLLLLDIVLPDENGLNILKKIRNDKTIGRFPIILFFDDKHTDEYDRINGLNAGADDYISKPFHTKDLIISVKTLLKNAALEKNNASIQLGELYLSISKHTVKVNGEEVILSYKEFQILNYFLDNIGIVLTRESIFSKVWGNDSNSEVRTVDVHMRTLRQKLGKAGDMIKTIRGVGYQIDKK